MSKKVLIAGIGGGKNKETGTYRVANYKIENKIYEQRSFITSALEEHYGIDKTIFIGTTGSMWDNLYEFYSKKFQKDYDENYHLDLMAIIDNATMDTNIDSLNLSKFNETFNDKIVAIVTKYGMNELEIFENFNLIIKLQDELEDGDEVYLDITHSFRSNAFWMFLVMNYLTDVQDKNITVKAISYGMLEAQKDGVAPVVDLNAFYKILQWIKGANNLKNYGNSYLIEENIENEKLSKKLKNFSDALNMNYIGSLRQSINSLKKLEDDIDNLEGPAKLIIPKIIKDFMDRFASEDKDYLFQAKLAKWHFEQKRYAMAYININESIIGFILDTLELPLLTGDRKKDENKLAKDWLNMIISRHENNKTYPNFKVDKDNMELYEYIKIFEHSRRVRNEIAHSIGGKDSAVNDIDSLKKYCDKIIDLLKNRNFIIRIDDKLQFSKKLKKDL
ncbi:MULTISPECIES: TIGR02221 family CRISPR-associated protein [Fusobacterium]|jgi:CRISPR-associated protein, TM1812 family|uniref:TIGR02221 family CRISPR-associated protein n=1 Tax=Fusobacterium TaxID=848 RepID=UPI000446F973|nr:MULTISPECIES: TIGR02221 family CRISPR-associated protein [Fusobacterium]EUB28220.1 CRISPR-associated protein, TM1812 family [Fusobacterium sp. CM22]PHI08963.1 CRISPR-associated protein [Fusobacterium polymorphum]